MMLKRFKPEILVLTFTLLALTLRVYRLNDLPPGLFWDEAFDGFDAARIVQAGVVPLFFEGNTGREPLTIYLQALGLLLFGVRTWALRIVPVMLGVLTIPAVYRLATSLYHGEKRAKWLGALAAGMIAVSFWHLDVSRLSLRVISFPLFSALAVWAFWRAWSNRRMLDFVWAGALLGVSLYTYLAARLLPFVLLGFAALSMLPGILRGPRMTADGRAMLRGLGLLLAVMLLVFLPLSFYYVGNPGAFLLRTSYISIFSSDPTGGAASIADNAVRVLRMFIDRGDAEWRHNLAGRPALDILGALGFWVGLAVAVWRFRQRYLFLLLWAGANLVTTLLSTEAPHFLRSIGALPAIVILSADGLSLLWDRLVPRMGWQPLLIGVVAFSGVLTYHDYFAVWSKTRETFDAFDGPVETVITRALSLSETEDVILPLRIFGTPNMQFRLASRFPGGVPRASFEDGNKAIWITAGGIDRSVILLSKDGVLPLAPLGDQAVNSLREAGKAGEPIKGGFGQTLAVLFPVGNVDKLIAQANPKHPLNANFGNVIEMFGYDIEPTTAKPGDKIQITYYWRALQEVRADYFVTSVLLDPLGESFGQTILEPVAGKYPTSLWQRGAVIPDSFQVQVPRDAHPGMYRFEVGLLNRIAFDQLLPLLGTQDRLLLDPITVVEAPLSADSVPNKLSVRLGDPQAITLAGYQVERLKEANSSLRVILYWRAERRVDADYSVFVHLLDGAGRMVAQKDGAPQNGYAPTSWWRPGDLIEDMRELQVPKETWEGAISIELGVYDPASGTRLALYDPSGTRQPDDRWLIPVQ